MSYEQLIARRHAEFLHEIRVMTDKAREEMARKFSFIARSRGQRRRYARTKQLRETQK